MKDEGQDGYVNMIKRRMEVEKEERWEEWANKLPFIYWPSDWGVKSIPPITMAVVRYRIHKPGGAIVSVYFDPFEKLGRYGEPYWEVLGVEGKRKRDEPERCAMDDVEQLLKLIEEA